QISRLFARARQVAPCVVFIDEIDSLVPARGSGGSLGEPQVTARVVNTILAEMDGMEELQSVVLIGATNRPALVDPALLRPGRFDELIYVGTPDEPGREHILKIHASRMPLAKDVDLGKIAADTDRFTGADLEDVVRRAGLIAIRKRGADAETVTAEDFAEALEDSRATVTPEMEREYEKMKGELKKRAVQIEPIGFIAPGMLESTRDKKHDE
ncbi:MAG: AAA family ATPase, partial [Novosphingobium sp.]|nr:AAA family ATPase [Novosphingobium sp.]